MDNMVESNFQQSPQYFFIGDQYHTMNTLNENLKENQLHSSLSSIFYA